MDIKNICYGKKYKNKQGEDKTQWMTIGKLLTFDDGGQKIHIDTIPVNWDGDACVFEKKEESPY